MTFVQSLLTGEFTGSTTLTDLVMTTGAPKTVRAGSSIVVWIARWDNNSLGTPFTVTDNLSNTYTAFTTDYLGFASDFFYGFFYTNSVSAGTLTSITVHFGGVGSLGHRVSACAAEFTDTMTNTAWTMDAVNTAANGLSSSPLTIGENLLFYCIGIGSSNDGVGGGAGFVPPDGFHIASSRITTGTAASTIICYRYGNLISETLTSTWSDVGGRRAVAIHGAGSPWSSFVPQIYRCDSP